jgi:hypothetical protein
MSTGVPSGRYGISSLGEDARDDALSYRCGRPFLSPTDSLRFIAMKTLTILHDAEGEFVGPGAAWRSSSS